jgi:peptidyl-prolyl cis-trans isomerase D
MAVIGSIRKRSGLLVIVIGLSIVGFLLMDALNSNTSVLRGGRKDTLGKVNGEKIAYTDFMRRVEDAVSNYQSRMSDQNITEEQRNMLRNQVWDEVVNEIILNNIYQHLGITVTSEELAEITIGKNPHPYIVQSFSNPQTGSFDATQVRLFLQSLDNDEPGSEPGTKRKMWTNFEKELKKDQLRQKYSQLISKGLIIPTWLAENAYRNQVSTADIKYVQLPYTDLKDEDIQPTDEDLKAYLKKHGKKYEQEEETRRFEYVTFDIEPSVQDTAAALQYLNEKIQDFIASKTTSEDSIFVKIYSEDPFDFVYSEKESLAGLPIADTLFKAPVRSVIGPFIDGGKYKYAKITDRKLLSDSVRVSEIVFSFKEVKTQGEADIKRKLFDSVYQVLDSLKGNFAQMAFNFSDDPDSRLKGGDIGWVKRNQKPTSYNNLLFYKAQKGKVYKTATQTELIIFTVTDEKPSKPGVQLAYFTRSILPSPETERNIYAAASKFASENQSEEKFKAAAQKLNLRTADNVRKNDFNVFGLGNAREVVRWAYNAKKGEVSGIMSIEKKYVVAHLLSITGKGVPEVEAIKDRLKYDYLRDKKTEVLSKKFSEVSASTIDEIGKKLQKEVVVANGVAFANPSLNGLLYEPNVAAAAMGAPQNKVVVPIKGNLGVYAIEVTTKNDAPKANDYSSFAQTLRAQIQNKSNRTNEVQKKLAKIEDFRFDFF